MIGRKFGMKKLTIKNKNIFLEGEIVHLEILTEKDLKIVYNWFNNKKITTKINKGYIPNTINKQKNFFKKISASDSDIQLSIKSKEYGNLIGLTGIHKIDWIHRTAEISIIINSKSEYKGAGTESIKLITDHCFKKLNIRKIKAGFWSNNLASKRVFEKNNFKFEYKSIKEFFYLGKYIDSIHYCKFNK